MGALALPAEQAEEFDGFVADTAEPVRQAGVELVARAGFLADLGLEPTAHPGGVGEYIAADATGLTAVPGVWVAGNVTDLFAQVGGAAAAGAFAAAAINLDLVTEEAQEAAAACSEPSSAEARAQ